jgi:hypothetical protein
MISHGAIGDHRSVRLVAGREGGFAELRRRTARDGFVAQQSVVRTEPKHAAVRRRDRPMVR